jgi:hypothetical protein
MTNRVVCGISALLLMLGVACSDDEHGEHDFDTFIECYEHHIEEGLTDVGATEECDGILDIDHDDNADCLADHAADVTDGVPQDAIDAHCDDVNPA